MAAITGGHMGHGLHLLKICVVLIKHFSHSHADTWWGLALHDKLVEVLS
jgi:hypothetical protein